MQHNETQEQAKEHQLQGISRSDETIMQPSDVSHISLDFLEKRNFFLAKSSQISAPWIMPLLLQFI